jgi:hypothetical protein
MRDGRVFDGLLAISTSNAGAILTERVHQDDPKSPIDNGNWAFADCSSTPFPGTSSTTMVCLKDGFDINHIYELVYTAKNPTVAGIGFAATRDCNSLSPRLTPPPFPNDGACRNSTGITVPDKICGPVRCC